MRFNLKRLLRLILNEAIIKGRFYMLLLAVSFSFLAFNLFSSTSTLLSSLDSIITIGPSITPSFSGNPFAKFHLIWFPKILLLTTSIFTSLSFSEYQENNISNFHISLPASKLEKWISKIILSIVLFPIVFVFLYQLFALISYEWQSNQVKLGLSDPYLWKHFFEVILIQCIIVFAALFYKKFSIFKTILALSAIYIFYNLFQLISFIIIKDDISLFGNGSIPGLTSLQVLLDKAGYQGTSDLLDPFTSFIGLKSGSLLMILAIVFLALSYLKFSEIES